MSCTATKVEVSQPTGMWMNKLLTPPRSAVQSKCPLLTQHPYQKWSASDVISWKISTTFSWPHL